MALTPRSRERGYPGVGGEAREVFPSPAWWDQGSMFGNGGLKSTVQDLLRYLEVYRTGGTSHGRRVVSAAGVATMTAAHQPIPLGGAYGYGLRINQVEGLGTTVEHGGGNKGVATQVVVVPERGITAVALTNLANAPASKLAYGAINAALGRAPETPWTTYPEHTVDRSEQDNTVGGRSKQRPYRLEPSCSLSPIPVLTPFSWLRSGRTARTLGPLRPPGQ